MAIHPNFLQEYLLCISNTAMPSPAFLYLGVAVFAVGVVVLVVRLLSKKEVENKLAEPVTISEAAAA